MEYQAIYGASKRGHKTLIYRGFEFWYHKLLVDDSVVWRCSKHQSFKCKARVNAKDLLVISNKDPQHTHEGNQSTALARRAIGEMKLRLIDSLASPSATYSAVASTLEDHVLMALPKNASLSRNLRRHRLTSQLSVNEGMPPIPVDLNFVVPARFMNFVLHDSGPGDERLMIFGCRELLDGLARSPMWLADGTFKVVPSLFFQLYTLHFQFVAGINPAAIYALVKNKTRQTYDRILEVIIRLVPAASPKVILTDFETAAMGSFRHTFPEARITGCYFHLTQSVIRKINEVGLKIMYETNDDIRQFLRCLASLSHVPPHDVEEAFDALVETMPMVEHMDEVVTYFEHTYVRGRRLRGRGENYGPALFPIETWNQSAAAGDGIARTNNICEGWHNGLQSLLQCSHPTMWRFLDGLSNDCAKQRANFLQGVTGVKNMSEKKYRLLKERVKRAVQTYGQTDILTYLRAIAHLSYS